MWPTMGRLTRESVTTLTTTMDYTLTSLQTIERIEVIDPATGSLVSDRVRSWQFYADEGTDPPTMRLLVPGGLSAGLTLRCIGYAPYVVPAGAGASCDIPLRLEWVVGAGARVEAFRFKVSQFANYERFQNENRQNALSPADIIELLRQARADFERGLDSNARTLTGARRAQLQTG